MAKVNSKKMPYKKHFKFILNGEVGFFVGADPINNNGFVYIPSTQHCYSFPAAGISINTKEKNLRLFVITTIMLFVRILEMFLKCIHDFDEDTLVDS